MSGPHFDLSDSFQPRSSWVHRLDPRTRVAGTLLFIVAVGACAPRAWWAYAVLQVLLLVFCAQALVGPLHVLRRSLVALPFLLAALPLALTTPGPPLWHVPLLGAVTAPGLLRVATVLARAALSVQAAVLLTATTRFPDLLWALGRLGLPQALVTIIGLGYRYFFVLADEVGRMVRARRARSGRAAGAAPAPRVAWQAQVAGRMAGTLLVRSLERSERVYLAMASRGYDGTPRTLDPVHPTRTEMVLAVGGALVLAALVYASWKLGPVMK